MVAKKSPLKALLDTSKNDTLVLGEVQRFMLRQQQKPSTRRADVIHPSEMCKADWCHRATYYRLAGWKEPKREVAFGLENVFDEGHDIHAKWHRRFWKMGKLRGIWRCDHCKQHWEATSPKRCPRVGCGSKAISYVEVPVYDDEHLIAGHADGAYDDPGRFEDIPLLEFKSIGLGTLRMEEPALLQKHAHKCEETSRTIYDLDSLWGDIRRPFPTHLKQGHLYMHCTGSKRMVFIYEFKPNQAVKEFVIRFNPKVVEPLLEACLDIKFALKKGSPPPCPNGGCADCSAYEKENDERQGATDEEPGPGEGQGVPVREDAAGEGRAVPARKAIRRVSRPGGGPGRPDGPGPDEAVRPVHGLGRLLERATGTG